MHTKKLTAGALARLAGCHRNTVSNYSKAGILNPITLTDKTRVFEPDDVARVRAAMNSRKGKPAAEGGGDVT
jgi:DNA-binding transcriptional MerR regulator